MNRIDCLFEYDPETGEFVRIGKVNMHDGSVIHCRIPVTGTNGNGYLRTFYDGRRHLVHRLAFLIMTGRMPCAIDHIDGNKQNNRWCNLREVTHKENMLNKGVYKTNRLGETGIAEANGKYNVTITSNGERAYVGGIETLADAIVIRNKLLREKQFHENHGGRASWQT